MNIKPAVRKNEKNSQGKCNIKMRISHRRLGDNVCKVRDIATTWYIEPKYMSRSGQILPSYPGSANLNLALSSKVSQYYDLLVKQFGNDVAQYDVNDLVRIINADADTGEDFFKYAEKRIESLMTDKRLSMSLLYRSTVKQLKLYHQKDDLKFSAITAGFLYGFDDYLKYTGGKSQNTMKNYQTNIRTIIYHAIDSKVIKLDISPYREYHVPASKRKRPRSLDINGIRRLISARPYLSATQQREIDTFLLMFFLGGINLKDLFYLRHENLKQNRISYSRFKTRRDYSIKVFPQVKEILDRWAGDEYLLCFADRKLKVTPSKRMLMMDSDNLRNCNKYLELAGKEVGLPIKLTTYVARYSWSTIASRIGITRDVIRHVLGHGLNTLTDLYIDFDQDKCDEAIEKVINALNISYPLEMPKQSS
jgi:site-specific recombinase XerD